MMDEVEQNLRARKAETEAYVNCDGMHESTIKVPVNY
jgi:hypothetical protein